MGRSSVVFHLLASNSTRFRLVKFRQQVVILPTGFNKRIKVCGGQRGLA